MKKTSKAVLFITSSIFIVMLLPIMFGSIYETYDDLGMRAAIEGSLFSDKPSSNLVFIKQILVKFIFALPSQNFLPYSTYDIVQFFLIGLSLGSILYMLSEEKWLRINFLLLSSGVFLVATTFVIQPQFTNTAGFLGIAGVLSLRKYILIRSTAFLAMFICFFSLSFWMRSEISLVILFIGFVALFELIFDKGLKPLMPAIIGTLSSIILTLGVEHYSISENPDSGEINLKRESISKFYDYNLGKKLQKPSNSDLIKNSIFSVNDIKLFHKKFYDWPNFDTVIPHINRISEVYYSQRDYLSSRINSSFYSFKYLLNSFLVFLIIPIILLILSDVFTNKKQNSRVYTLELVLVLLGFILYLGFIQRYSLSRIYITPFLLVIILFIVKLGNVVRLKWVSVIIFTSLFIYTTKMCINHNRKVQDSRLSQQYFNELVQRDSISSIVLFNADFDLSQIFPVYPQNLNTVRFRGVGIVSERESVVKDLLKNEKFTFASNKRCLGMIDTFFKEHYKSDIEFELIDEKFQLYNVKLN